MRKSIWQKDAGQLKFENLSEKMSTDVLIIGGGITGITTAYNFIDEKHSIILLEADKFLTGATCKSTGKLTYLQDLKYQDIYNVFDFDTAKLYYEAQKDAIRLVKKIVKDNDIECNLTKTEAVTFTKDNKEIKKFDKEEEILNLLGVKYYINSTNIKDEDIKRMILVKNTYVFNPVKYLKGLLKAIKKSSNIKTYENSRVTKIKKEDNYYVAYANGQEVKAKKIVVACSYPFFTIPGFIPFKTYMEKSYITATKVDETKDICGITSNYPTISFRYHNDKNDNYFIYLNNSSKICDKLNYKKNYDECVNKAKDITGKTPNYKWTNMDVVTNDFMPLIGRISEEDKNAFIATGYNTWGMTNGTIAGKILYDLIRDRKNKYEKVFDPTRSMNIIKFKNFLTNTMLSNTKAYTFNLIKKNPSWYKDKACVTKVDGKRVGVYFDKDGNKHTVSNICPHLKCFLTFNEVDKTWDCPCHGSRFDIDGNVVKGPACYSIKIDEAK
ncbi:FAD-dependent oxidoreductase [uncultured Desulfovibrio sp.]|uniref:FAD-dependent oxidoreductase n=1 Tax=uncultured Desulfovibrio sp. TaxID=167968 RepID=UPI0026045737|nr:FAD-dependent oxidoreductase [uncultured Desulfovibrio sp.]